MTKFCAKNFLKNTPKSPGVYRMINASGDVIYVGKAKNLAKRLASYFRKKITSAKTKALVSHIDNILLTVTNSETEALILEHNLIKEFSPKYNVLLRDDKSYPYILLTKSPHPRLMQHRGAKKRIGEYFGPYPNAGAVRKTLHLLQKIFPIRQCEDSMYANRTRPCLMYQIGRCSAPCVPGYISDVKYEQQVELVRLFLQGKDRQLLELLVNAMQKASDSLDFEQAAKIRDQIKAVRKIQESQSVSGREQDLDVIGCAYSNGIVSVHVLFIRNGKVLGSRNYFPQIPAKTSIDEIYTSFIGQFYLAASKARTIPYKIVLQNGFNLEKEIFNQSLMHIAQHKVNLITNSKGEQAKFLQLAITNAQSALAAKLNNKTTLLERFSQLEQLLSLESIERMECFDISHTMGERTVASCVVFDKNGPLKSDYRRYNIKDITPGDDYAAMAQVLTRRYSKQFILEKIPDIIFIDGGRGQLNRAIEIVEPLVQDWPKKPILIAIAKGKERKAGLETIILDSGASFNLPVNSPALHLMQHIRDESHKHAITGHRNRRAYARKHSILEDIAGVGSKRRQALLKFLGGMQEVKSASIAELAKVPGISYKLAEKIHAQLND